MGETMASARQVDGRGWTCLPWESRVVAAFFPDPRPLGRARCVGSPHVPLQIFWEKILVVCGVDQVVCRGLCDWRVGSAHWP